jgi:S-adenosylmethionine synthetase
MISKLKLLRPIFKETAAYGHFGRNNPNFTWEKTDQAEALAELAGISEPPLPQMEESPREDTRKKITVVR